MIKPTKVLTYQECQKAKLPVTPPLTDDERVAQAQRDTTFRDTIKQIVEWLKERNKFPQVKGLVLSVEDWQELEKLAEGE